MILENPVLIIDGIPCLPEFAVFPCQNLILAFNLLFGFAELEIDPAYFIQIAEYDYNQGDGKYHDGDQKKTDLLVLQ